MSVILANWLAALIFAAIFLVAGGLFLAAVGDDNFQNDKGIAIVLALVFMIFSAWGFSYSTTHYVVPANKVAIVIDMKTGQTVGGLRSPGVNSKSWIQKKLEYPGQMNYLWCPVVTPSVRGGAEVETTVCFTFDASKVDWEKQYRAYNGDETFVLNGWLNEFIQSTIAASISTFTPQQLTDERVKVEEAIKTNSLTWFTDNGIPLKTVTLRNWKFTSAEMTKAYEAAQVSVAKINAAENERKAAEVQVQTATLRYQACLEAGFTSQEFCLGFLQLQWLQNLPTLPNNFVLSLGGGSPSVAFPATVETSVP
jgi:hypothetical protein